MTLTRFFMNIASFSLCFGYLIGPFFVGTASSEEPGNFEQTDQRWLLLPVPPLICRWNCGAGCRNIFAGQIFVMQSRHKRSFQLRIYVLIWKLVFIAALLELKYLSYYIYDFFWSCTVSFGAKSNVLVY